MRQAIRVLCLGLWASLQVPVCGQLTLPSPSQPSTPTPGVPPAPTTPPPAAPDKREPGSPPIRKAESPAFVNLRPRFKVGEDARLKLSLKSVHETTSTGLPGLVDEPAPNKPAPEEKSVGITEQEFVIIFRPKETTQDGTSTVDVVFESIKMKIESDWLTDSFDSTKPTTPTTKKKPAPADPLQGLGNASMLEESLRPLVGETLTLTVDRDGNVREVKGGDKIAALFNQTGGVPGAPGQGAPDPESLFGGILTAAGTRADARIGDKWTTSEKLGLSMMGAVSMQTDYTLRNVNAGIAQIDFAGKLLPDSNAPQNVPFNIKGASYDGSCFWDTEAGFVRSMNSTQKIETQLSVGPIKGTAKGTQTMKVERLK